MSKQKRKPLFDHFDVSEQWRQSLVEDFNHVVPISAKAWDFFKEAQLVGALKKYPPAPGDEEGKRRSAAIEKFRSVVAHLSSISYEAVLPAQDYFRHTPRGALQDISCALGRARSVCRQILGHFSTEAWFKECRHGPGTSLGVSFADSGNSAKFVPPWTTTESAVPWFEHYLRYDSLLARALRGTCPDLAHPGSVWKYVEIVKSSRLTTVPKNASTDRTIAVEPTLNMFLQQGLGRLIASKLVPFGVDIQVQQDVHRKMAFESSITRKFATIDFSSASDCVGTELLKFLLPPVWFDAVEQVRCPSVLVEGEVVDLPCIATMGNATTFVLETLVFYCLAIGCIHTKRTKTRSMLPDWEIFELVSVFGDDCILPVEYAPFFMEVCKTVGFLVNEEKSFFRADDPFRESCGADFLGGYNVRPVYLGGPRSNKPSNLRAWLYTVWNLTCKRLMSSLGTETYVYSSTLQLLARLISQHNKELYLVAGDDPDDAGLKTFGDEQRLLRLFSISPAHGYLDKNGTLRYRRLVSAPPKVGIFSPELEMWIRLKFPAVCDPFHPRKRLKDFTVRKSDRGYVVGWSSSFDDDLRWAYGIWNPVASEEGSMLA